MPRIRRINTTRKLNAEYIRRTMRKEELRGLEVLVLVDRVFGVSWHDKSLMRNGRWIDKDAPRRNSENLYNYRGWVQLGKLYCVKCWSPIIGIPREILARNQCESCNSQLYRADDEEWLDLQGYSIFRDRATRYMQLAVRRFASLIEGSEHCRSNGTIDDGFHKDHIFSVHEAFENDIEECVVSSPPNIRILPARTNSSKGRKSGVSIDSMRQSYSTFLLQFPEWQTLINECEAKQLTFVFTKT